MQWLLFTFLTSMVALGIRKMTRDAHEAMRDASGDTFFDYRRPPSATPNNAAPTPPPIKPAAQEMVQCPRCKAYGVKGMPCCS